MGLHYDLSGVDKTRPAWTDRTERHDDITTAVIFATISTSPSDDGRITERVAPEFFARVYAYERVRGSYITDGNGQPVYLTWDDMLDHVGLYTNMFPRMTRRAFVNHQVKAMREGWMCQPDPRPADVIAAELHRLIAEGRDASTWHRSYAPGVARRTKTLVTTAR